MKPLHAAQCPLVIAPCQIARSRGSAAVITQSSVLIELLAIRLGCQKTAAKSLVISPWSSIRGFSLISAIFLLVVIAALGTFAVTLSTIQQQSSALDVMGARAYQAARAGIEWGAYQVLRNVNCQPSTPLPALPNTLADYTVTVTCSSAATTEAGTPVTMYQLTSKATLGTPATQNYVERLMSVTIAK